MKRTMFISMLTAALMGSAYANTDCTATPGTTYSSPPDNVYGTYADIGEASGASVRVFEVETGGYEYIVIVRGGMTYYGNAANNTVTMEGGEIRAMYGGYVAEDGDAAGNTVTVTGGQAPRGIVGGYVGGDGDAYENTVTMSDCSAGTGVYGGSAKTGKATKNTVSITRSTASGTLYGGFSVSGDATENAVTINDSYVDANVFGGNTSSGNATGNTVGMTGGQVGSDVYGGYVQDTGDATGNTVTMSGGEVYGWVCGGYVQDTGDATENAVTINDGYVDYRVYGGYTSSGDATGNSLTMTGGEVGDDVVGGYTYSGNATDNTVDMTGGEVGSDVYGGFVADSGVATGNTVDMTGGVVNYDVYGGYTYSGNATYNTVTMSGGEVGDVVYGGYVDDSGNATGNTVTIAGGYVRYYVYGGHTYSGNATENAVTINDGYVGDSVYGGYVDDSGNATGNAVDMTGGYVYGYVYGGYTQSGNATDNTVTMTGGEVGHDVYGSYTRSGDASYNTVHLVGEGASYTVGDTTYKGGNIAIQCSVHAAYVKAGGVSSNNSVHAYGTGINIGGSIDSCQMLNFHIVQGQAGAPATPMVTLGGALNLEGVELGFNGDAVTDWAAFEGTSITLVSMTSETITGLVTQTDPVDITDEGGKTVATATLTHSDDWQTLSLTDIQGVAPVPTAGPDALDVALVNSLWASSAYVREFVRLSGAQGYALKAGDTAVWGGGFGAFMHATGDRGFKSDGGGYGIGVNHAFSANTQAGISLGQGFGSYHNSGKDGAKVHQRAILAAATASTRITKDLSLGAHLAFGNVRNRADCRLDGATERARWNDNVFNLGARVAYDFHVTETTAVTPFLGLDWAYGAQESINGAFARHYSHGRLNELRMPVGVTVSTATEVGSTKLLPQLSVAYVPSLAQQVPHANVSDKGQNYRVKGYAPGRNAFMLNAGVNVLFSDSWSAGAFYTLETRRHCVDQSVNASVRYTF